MAECDMRRSIQAQTGGVIPIYHPERYNTVPLTWDGSTASATIMFNVATDGECFYDFTPPLAPYMHATNDEGDSPYSLELSAWTVGAWSVLPIGSTGVQTATIYFNPADQQVEPVIPVGWGGCMATFRLVPTDGAATFDSAGLPRIKKGSLVASPPLSNPVRDVDDIYLDAAKGVMLVGLNDSLEWRPLGAAVTTDLQEHYSEITGEATSPRTKLRSSAFGLWHSMTIPEDGHLHADFHHQHMGVKWNSTATTTGSVGWSRRGENTSVEHNFSGTTPFFSSSDTTAITATAAPAFVYSQTRNGDNVTGQRLSRIEKGTTSSPYSQIERTGAGDGFGRWRAGACMILRSGTGYTSSYQNSGTTLTHGREFTFAWTPSAP